MRIRHTGKARYLVAHDYGMGALWWWVWATSPEEIIRSFAEVEVVSDADAINRAESWWLEEVDIDTPNSPLSMLRSKRDAQRERPGFGALVGRERVYLDWDKCSGPREDDDRYLEERGSDGRLVRVVKIGPTGDAIRWHHDWPFNPPLDLHDPDYAAMEIPAEEFEAAWTRARPKSQDDDF